MPVCGSYGNLVVVISHDCVISRIYCAHFPVNSLKFVMNAHRITRNFRVACLGREGCVCVGGGMNIHPTKEIMFSPAQDSHSK